MLAKMVTRLKTPPQYLHFSMAGTTIQMRFPRASTSVGAAQDFIHFMVLFALLRPLIQRGPTYIYALLS